MAQVQAVLPARHTSSVRCRKKALLPVVVRNDKRQAVYEVRRVAAHEAALAQSLEDERNVSLLEVAHSTMDKLGTAAGGALGEIGLFNEHPPSVRGKPRPRPHRGP